MKRFVISALGVAALTVAALGGFAGFGGLSTPRTAIAQQAPLLPEDCIGEDWDSAKTIYVYAQTKVVLDTGMLIVIGRPNLPNNITVPNATRVCLIGGSRDDTLTGGRGDDVIVGNGAWPTRDHINAMGGNDVCYFTTGTVVTNCENQSLQNP